MKKQLVQIKGTKEGLVLRLDDCCAYVDLVEELKQKVFEGGIDGTVDVQLDVGYRYVSDEHKKELVEIIESSGKMNVTKIVSEVLTNEQCMEKLLLNNCETYIGIVRSGQVITTPGDIIIIGDVNPNGKVEAGGNIYILGNLKGIVHAGKDGNQQAIICASRFKPTHVLIADRIEVMSNENPTIKENSDQMFAYINKEGEISYSRLQELKNIYLQKVEKGGS